MSPERYTKTIEVAFYVVRKESAAKHRLSAPRMRRPKLVVKWFYKTVFFTIPVTAGGASTALMAKNEGRGKCAAGCGNTAPASARQVVLALPHVFQADGAVAP
ncbi:MAG: hypothetical protein RSE46_20120 [Janthinobacterium sp.]